MLAEEAACTKFKFSFNNLNKWLSQSEPNRIEEPDGLSLGAFVKTVAVLGDRCSCCCDASTVAEPSLH